MGYGSWSPVRESQSGAFHEKAFRRKGTAALEEPWHALSLGSRRYFVEHLSKTKFSEKSRVIPTNTVPPEILEELTKAGLAEARTATKKGQADGVTTPEAASDFAARIGMLAQFHLLDAKGVGRFKEFASQTYYASAAPGIVRAVLVKAGVTEFLDFETMLDRYMLSHRWAGWVLNVAKSPLNSKIMAEILKSEQPIPLANLPKLVKEPDLKKIQASLDSLISYLGVVEDLDPTTLDIVIGLPPVVRAKIKQASLPRARPALVTCDRPSEFGPEGNLLAADIRAWLLEALSEPPRLKQDGYLFQKELDRFIAAFDPYPDWLLETLESTDEKRVDAAGIWATNLDLASESFDEKTITLKLTAKGRKWLSNSIDEQSSSMIALVQQPSTFRDLDSLVGDLLIPDEEIGRFDGSGDLLFTGCNVIAVKGTKAIHYLRLTKTDIQTFRAAIDRAFQELPPGVFFTVESIKRHLAFDHHNPLRLGQPIGAVTIMEHGRRIPDLEEEIEAAGSRLIEMFIRRRLIPFGAVRAATDEKGTLCVAIEPGYDAYFGRASSKPKTNVAADAPTRVVFQPDFSVMIIGLDPTPVTELVPFCERTNRGGTPGAMILKITRDSVIKAVNHGLKPDEIVSRLKKNASVEVPANVLHEVQGWANLVRRITQTTITVLRAPDKATADRVMMALKSGGERLNDTLVAIDRETLTSADRAKLLAQGLLVDTDRGAKPKAKKKKSGW